jgi:hypothetical protein
MKSSFAMKPSLFGSAINFFGGRDFDRRSLASMPVKVVDFTSSIQSRNTRVPVHRTVAT